MPSFFDLQRYAATGIASPDMTAFDKMRALAAFGGTVKTLAGIPPLSFPSDGSPITIWSMLGNEQQTGTPSPDNIIMPTFCGVRTENLYNDTATITLPPGLRYGMEMPAGTYSIRNDTDNAVYSFTNGGANRLAACDAHTTNTVNLEQVGSGASGFFMAYNSASLGGVTIVSGSTPPNQYIPYGFQIPITCAGQTVPVYLGQTQTVRRVKKLVLTGNENWVWRSGEPSNVYFCSNTNLGISTIAGYGLSNAYRYTEGTGFNTLEDKAFIIGINNSGIRDTSLSLLADFKSYLAAQYAAGTPVTIWYVLATPETAIVNEPLAKIGDYADELHSTDSGVTIPTVKGSNTLTVNTDLQPSEMAITYKG